MRCCGFLGRLGHGNTLTLSRPKRLAALEPYVVEDVSAGYFHSVCVTREPRGWMFSWGSNSAGDGISRNVRYIVPLDYSPPYSYAFRP